MPTWRAVLVFALETFRMTWVPWITAMSVKRRSDSDVMMLLGAVKRIHISEGNPVTVEFGFFRPANAPTSNIEILLCSFKVMRAER